MTAFLLPNSWLRCLGVTALAILIRAGADPQSSQCEADGKEERPSGAALLQRTRNAFRSNVSDAEASLDAQDVGQLSESRAAISSTRGFVINLTTFGAPHTGLSLLENQQSSDGIFPGVRAYNFGDYVPNIVRRFGFPNAKHPKLNSLGADCHIDGGYMICEDLVFDAWGPGPEPGRTDTWDLRMHGYSSFRDEWFYHRVNKSEYQQLAVDAKLCAASTYADPAVVDHRSYIEDQAKDLNYTVIGYMSLESCGFGQRDFDNVFLYQHKQDKHCVLSFSGMNGNLGSTATDMTGTIWKMLRDRVASFFGSSTFCGQEAFKAWHNELTRMLDYDYATYKRVIQDRLPSCSKVAVSGESMGGAIGSLFAACANMRDVTHAEQQKILWYPLSEPQLLPDDLKPLGRAYPKVGQKYKIRLSQASPHAGGIQGWYLSAFGQRWSHSSRTTDSFYAVVHRPSQAWNSVWEIEHGSASGYFRIRLARDSSHADFGAEWYLSAHDVWWLRRDQRNSNSFFVFVNKPECGHNSQWVATPVSGGFELQLAGTSPKPGKAKDWSLSAFAEADSRRRRREPWWARRRRSDPDRRNDDSRWANVQAPGSFNSVWQFEEV